MLDASYKMFSLDCNQNCNCQPNRFKPVCSEDGTMNFFSACHAGCKVKNSTEDDTTVNTNQLKWDEMNQYGWWFCCRYLPIAAAWPSGSTLRRQRPVRLRIVADSGNTAAWRRITANPTASTCSSRTSSSWAWSSSSARPVVSVAPSSDSGANFFDFVGLSDLLVFRAPWDAVTSQLWAKLIIWLRFDEIGCL